MNECVTACDFMSVQQGRQEIACAGPCDLICGLENMVTIITALTTRCNSFPTPTRLVVGKGGRLFSDDEDEKAWYLLSKWKIDRKQTF